MKFNTSSQTWGRGIAAVQNATGSAIANPIVENIHISCEEGKVRFLATNLNLTIRCEGEANVEEVGEIVMPCKLISSVVKDLPQGEVIFEESNETVKMKCGEFSAKLKGQPGELFPPFIVVEEGEDLTIPAAKLKDIIKKTLFATSSEKSRYELDGVKFEVREKQLSCISTDGRRLCFYKEINDQFPETELTALIPTKTLHEVQNTIPDDGIVVMRFAERKVQFVCGDVTIVSNLLSDNFPQYDRIIPPEGHIRVHVNRDNFSSAVKRASNLTSIETNMLILKLADGFLEICGEREEIGGEGRDRVPADYQGEAIELRYNYRFIMDFIRVTSEDTVELELGDPRRPGILRGKDNVNYKYVIMPMRPPDEEEKK